MRAIWNNFNGGLANEILESRYQLEKYPSLARVLQNFVPQLHGSAKRREGTRFISELENGSTQSVLIPFSYNTKDFNNFAVVLNDKNIQVFNGSGRVASFASPYNAVDLLEISYSQLGDIVYLAHENYPLHKLVRTGNAPNFAWTIQEVRFNASLAPPSSVSAAFTSGPVVEGQTVAPQTYSINYKVTAIDAYGIESVGSATGTTLGRYATDWISGDSVKVTFSAVSGAVEYNIYKEGAGYFGFIGTTTTTSFQDQNYDPDLTAGLKEDWFPFENGNNPSIVGFHNQRLVLANTKDSPQTFYMSRAGDFENFRKSRPMLDDDPVEFTIATGAINEIQWVSSFGDLLIGTSGAEYKVSGSGGTGTAVTASDVSIITQSFNGSAKIPPILISNSIMHAQVYNSRVRDLYYSLEKDGYAGNDLTILAPDIFGTYKLKQWAFIQIPNSTLWCVREDGKLFSLTYMKEQNIYGWAEHITDGKFISVCSVLGKSKNILYTLVEREVDGQTKIMVEVFDQDFDNSTSIENAWFLDSAVFIDNVTNENEISVPSHLDHNNINMLIDGIPYENVVVIDGKVSVNGGKNILIGRPYDSILSMMPFNADTQQGSTLGVLRTVGQVTLKVNRSVSGKYGTTNNFDEMFDIKLAPVNFNKAYDVFSGEHTLFVQSSSKTEEALYFGQRKPLPLEIVSIIARIDFPENPR